MDHQKNRSRRRLRDERRRTEPLTEVKSDIETLLRLRDPSESRTASGKESEQCDVRKEGESSEIKRSRSLDIFFDFCDVDDREHRELTQDCVDWSLRNHLLINTGKTKEMVNSSLNSTLIHFHPHTVEELVA
ncbi:hypothetical protein AOLI_G00104510 [Acnodon oligacanthus]